MTDNPAIDVAAIRNGRRNLFFGLIVLAIVAAIVVAVLVSTRQRGPAPGNEINVPRMQNVPPPSQRLNPK
jgi:hypothetical protein